MKQSDVGKLPEGTHKVEPGLYLRVRGKYRNFFVRLQVDGKRRDMGIGSADGITLADAKMRAAELRAEALKGRQDWGKKEEVKRTPLFKDYAPYALKVFSESRKWRGVRTEAFYYEILAEFLLPPLGKKRIDEIYREDVLAALRPLWGVKVEASKRARRILEMTFDLAVAEGYMDKRNPAAWRGNLSLFLAPAEKGRKIKHHEAPTLEEAQKVASLFKESPFPSKNAALFGLLTATRAGEFTKAEWKEIDFEAAIWTIPPERRKDGKPECFRVPLSTQAVSLLKSLERRGPYVFQSRTCGKPIDCVYARRALVKGVSRQVTMHGCRSTFRDWCAREGIDPILAEKSLMHAVGGVVYQAYQRDDLLEQRRPIMQRWADVLFAEQSGDKEED